MFGHGYGGSRGTFLKEAVGLAAHGVVSVLPTTKVAMTGDPGTDADTLVGSVLIERRALDVLIGREDVDPARLGYVGHSWGAVRSPVPRADPRDRTAENPPGLRGQPCRPPYPTRAG